jgi:hypothetical protein
MKRELASLFFVVVLGFAGATSAQVFDIPMTPEQETEAVESDATGHCLARLDGNTFEVICRHTVENVTQAHIHRAAAGVDGPITHPFESAESPFRGVFEFSADDLADLEAGLLYINVHSDAFPAGEVRGQIGPRADSAVFFPLEAEQETGQVNTDNTGHCMAVLNPLGTAFTIACSHTVEDVSGAHIHRGAAGEDGPIVFGFDEATTIFDQAIAEDERFDEAYRFSDLLADLRRGDLYVNVHSPAFPGGELRGQITRPGLVQYFPQFGSGGANGQEGLASSVVLTNPSPTEVTEGTMFFFAPDGQPMTVGIVEGDEVAEVDFSIQPFGSVTFTTDGLGELIIGSAETISNSPIGGIIRFRLPEFGTAGFGSSPPLQSAIVPARRSPEINTAIAVRNAETFPITVTLEMRGEDGESLGGAALAEREIPPDGRIAEFLDELFEDLDTTDLVGTIVISTGEGSFSAISLELGTEAGELTALPVTPVEETQ